MQVHNFFKIVIIYGKLVYKSTIYLVKEENKWLF
jgi:hypothetical protein